MITPMPNFQQKHIDKFWSRVNITADVNQCWEWKAGLRTQGYGGFAVGQTHLIATRVAYFLSNNVDPKELYVLHKCDNRKCTNPNHLFLGTAKENSNDMVKKGRYIDGHKTKPEAFPKGERHWKAKLTEIDVLNIRSRYSKGEGRGALSREFGVTYSMTHYIVSGKSWKHILPKD